MQNFIYDIPTKVYFGKEQIQNLPAIVKSYGTKPLLVYGGGSIKRNGIYDTISNLFAAEQIEFMELSGVEPNPRITTVRKGIEFAVNMLLMS